MAEKPRLSFWQIWNMSFGFMGIQFGWGLQLANMSGIYTYLGAKPEEVRALFRRSRVIGRRFTIVHVMCGREHHH